VNPFWESVAARSNGLYSSDDLESAAYRLVAEQVLYHADRHSRVAYSLIDQYENDFKRALQPFGIHLLVNRGSRYACALPAHSRTGTASVQQTLFALVLRGVYDDSARIGDLTPDGEVWCDLIEFSEKYRLMTGRELPSKGEFDSLFLTARRWGMVRKVDDSDLKIAASSFDGANFTMAIRPAIIDLLGETALQRLAVWQGISGSDETGVNALDDSESPEELNQERSE
jgi:hypothetical protein